MAEQLTIVGGGITGLASALLAARAGRRVRVLEASSKFGGLLDTFEIGGARLERFYHHFFTHDAEIHWVARQLGIEDRFVYHDATMGVYRGGRIYNFNGLADLLRFKPIGWLDKLRFCFSSAYLAKLANWRHYEHLAALDWFGRYAGKSSADSLWRPMLNVKFGPYADRVPVSWMIGRLRQRVNSRTKGSEKLGYVQGSLSVLLDRLLAELERLGVELRADAPITGCQIEGDALRAISTSETQLAGGDFLFTVPSPVIARLLADTCPSEASKHAVIEYFGAICVVLEMTAPLSDVYWLNVADEGFPFGGIIEQTNLISPRQYGGSHIAYLSRYVTKDEPLTRMSDDAVADLMLDALRRIYPSFTRDRLTNVYVFRTSTAATVCDLNFSRKVPPCRTPISHLFVANMCHVYPDERSVNNSIRVAAEACRVLGSLADDVPRNASLSAQIGFDEQPPDSAALIASQATEGELHPA